MIALSNTPILETERLILRAPSAVDWPVWHEFYMSDRAQYVGGGTGIAPGQSWRAFGHVIGHWVMRGYGMFVFADKATGQTLGGAGPWFPEGWAEQEIGWTVWAPEAEGKGMAAEAATAALRYAFDDLGWDTAVSYIVPENARSIALAMRLGAQIDPDAPHPATSDGAAVQVYRHPKGAQ